MVPSLQDPEPLAVAEPPRPAEPPAVPGHARWVRASHSWSAIAEWTGVPLSRVLDAAGLHPAARFVTFHSYDDWADSIDLLDALHPQTLLA
jgi:hypothetical protein